MPLGEEEHPWTIPTGRTRRGGIRRAGCDATAGQVVPLMAGLLALAAVVLVGLVALGNLVAQRAQAQTAADAAALAGAAQRRSRPAVTVAADNDGDLESFAVKGAEVEVTVRVGDVRATSRARREW